MKKKVLTFIILPISVAFFITSKFIFDKIYGTSQVVIDEAFHLPQGLQYCNFNFSTVSLHKLMLFA